MINKKHSIFMKEYWKLKKEIGFVSPLKGRLRNIEFNKEWRERIGKHKKGKTMIELYGEKRTAEIIEKRKQTRVKTAAINGYYHSDKTLNKMSISNIGLKKQSVKGRKVHSMWMKKYNNSLSYEQKIKHIIEITSRTGKDRISKAELILKKCLEENDIKFVYQYPHKLGIADFYLPDKNLIVECNGSYWHSLPKSIARDKKKMEWFNNNGYKALIFCSEDIVDNKNSLNKVIDLDLMKGGRM